jgi:hypothetical protein
MATQIWESPFISDHSLSCRGNAEISVTFVCVPAMLEPHNIFVGCPNFSVGIEPEKKLIFYFFCLLLIIRFRFSISDFLELAFFSYLDAQPETSG